MRCCRVLSRITSQRQKKVAPNGILWQITRCKKLHQNQQAVKNSSIVQPFLRNSFPRKRFLRDFLWLTIFYSSGFRFSGSRSHLIYCTTFVPLESRQNGLMVVFTNRGENRKSSFCLFDCVNYGRAIIYYQIHSFEKRNVQPFSDSVTLLVLFSLQLFFAIVDRRHSLSKRYLSFKQSFCCVTFSGQQLWTRGTKERRKVPARSFDDEMILNSQESYNFIRS